MTKKEAENARPSRRQRLSYCWPKNESTEEGIRWVDWISRGHRVATKDKSASITMANKAMEEKTPIASRENDVTTSNLV